MVFVGGFFFLSFFSLHFICFGVDFILVWVFGEWFGLFFFGGGGWFGVFWLMRIKCPCLKQCT